MKIRYDFVTNSSSTSDDDKKLIKDLGNFKEGDDLYDIDNFEVALEEFDYLFPKKHCPLCSFKSLEPEDIYAYLNKVSSKSKKSILEKQYSEYKKISNGIYISIVLEDMGKTREEIEKEITSKFKNIIEFYKFIED